MPEEQPADSGEPGGAATPTPEQLVEEFRKLKVSDLVASTVLTLSQLGYGKLDPEALDLEQARLAIDSIAALLPIIHGSVPDELSRDFERVLANLRLAYASAAAGTTADDEAAAASHDEGGEQEPAEAEGEGEGTPRDGS